MRKILLKSVLVGMLLPTLTSCQAEESTGNTMNKELCREEMVVFLENMSTRNVAEILNMKNKCGKQQVYYYALSSAYYLEFNYPEAITAARAGLEIDSEFNSSLYYFIFNSEVKLNDYQAARNVAEEASQKLPESDIGFFLLGIMSSLDKNYPVAIQYLEKVFSEESAYEAKQYLTIAYYNINQFNKSVVSFENGARLNNAIYLDKQAVLSASASYYEIGNKQAALDVLNRHVELVPESRSHPMIIKMYEILTQPE